MLKELIVNVLKEISIEELFKNNSKKENSDSDENSESDKESKIPFLFNSIFSDKNDQSNDSDNQIPSKGKIFLADLILITGLKQYVSMKRQNQNHLLKQRISLYENNNKKFMVESSLEKEMKNFMMKEVMQNMMHRKILNICNNLDNLKEIKDFLSKKVKNFEEDLEKGICIGDGTLSLIEFKKTDDQYIFKYIREDYTSINTIIEILLMNNIIKNEKDFINLMELDNKSNNILHFENIIKNYFDKANIYPFRIRFVIKHIYDSNLNILEEKKYISGMNIENIENNQINKKFNEFNELKKNNFLLLDIISSNTIEYIKNQMGPEEKKEFIINK